MQNNGVRLVPRAVTMFAVILMLGAPTAAAQRFTPLSHEEAKKREAALLVLFNTGRAVPLTHFDQKQDVQELMRSQLPDAGTQRTRGLARTAMLAPLPGEDAHAYVVLYAKPGISGKSDGEFVRGVEVGSATTLVGVPSLKLVAGKTNLVFIYKDNANKWFALIDDAMTRRLEVTRYTYKGYQGNITYYADAARWDWERGANAETPATQVMGFPCGRGWCLVGTLLAAPANGVDPLDLDKPGTGGLPHFRRIPGWFDRAIDPSNPAHTIWIYPDRKLETLNAWAQADQAPYPVAYIEDRVTAGSLAVEVKHYPATNMSAEKFELLVDSKPFTLTPTDMGLNIPSGVRWTSALTSPAVATTKAGVWMRCPNGCCDAEITY